MEHNGHKCNSNEHTEVNINNKKPNHSTHIHPHTNKTQNINKYSVATPIKITRATMGKEKKIG